MTKATRARYTLEFKLEAVRLVKGGQSMAATAKILGIAEQTLHNWIRADKDGRLMGAGTQAGEPRADGDRAAARRAGAREDGARHSGKSDGVLREGAGVKYAWIERHRQHWPVSLACEVLGVSPSGYHEHKVRVGASRGATSATTRCWCTSAPCTPRRAASMAGRGCGRNCSRVAFAWARSACAS